MLRTITQKCPCGYLFEEKRQIEIQTIPASNIITCKPGRVPVIHDKPTQKEEIVKREILNGNEEFKKIFVLTDYYHRSQEGKKIKLLICPKCGTVLLPSIAMDVKEVEEK